MFAFYGIGPTELILILFVVLIVVAVKNSKSKRNG